MILQSLTRKAQKLRRSCSQNIQIFPASRYQFAAIVYRRQSVIFIRTHSSENIYVLCLYICEMNDRHTKLNLILYYNISVDKLKLTHSLMLRKK
jgi:hypothetical protein